MSEYTLDNRCYNCHQRVGLDHRYCPNCGQAHHPTRLTIGVLIKDFINNFFDLDSRFFQTLAHIYSPSFLTKEYVAGRRRKYSNPIRLFIISMIVLLAILGYQLNETAELETLDFTRNLTTSIAESNLLEKYEQYTDSTYLSDTERPMVDSIKKVVFGNISHLDSNFMKMPDLKIGRKNMKEYAILTDDALNLSYDSLFIKYQIEEFWDQLILKQFLKAYKDPGATIRFGVSNSLWIIVLTILFISILLKMLYIRNGNYYIEHVILQCNIHSLLFILLIMGILIGIATHTIKEITNLVMIIFPVYAFVMFYKYYRQGFFKTLVKFLIYGFFYNIIILFCALIVILASFLLF